ncbi:MAG TPA: ABC transporter ATP-binding protein [Pyrinomonadaceae bacterium]|nr:ABC transporter ATP-binding protein [Pyrinomonadaceae bacterium]
MKDLKRLLDYVKPHWLAFLLAFAAMILVAVFETATGALLVPIFDQFLPTAPQNAKTLFDLNSLVPRDSWFHAWLVISALLLTFTICKGIAEYFSSYLMAKIGQSAVLDLRLHLYEHLLKQSAAFFERHRTNYLVSRLVVSCSAIENAVSANLRDVLRESLILVFLISAAFYYNWRLMLGAILIGPLIAFLTTKFSKALRKFADESFEGNKLLTDTAQETLANQAIVKAFGAEAREKKRFENASRLIARANLRSGRLAATSPPVIEFIGYIALLILLYFGFREINAGRLEPSQFIAFLYFLFRSYDPMRKISRQHNEISKAFAAARDVWDVLDENETLPESPNPIELKTLETAIEFRNVSFRYSNDPKLILDNVNITFPKGSVVAIVGESGSGKSSLIKLIQRLYDPIDGTVLWDRTDLRNVSLSSLHKMVALVTQETVLFNDTVAYNISYGKPDASNEDIVEAAKIAFADDFIRGLPNGYDTLVGERGMMLSGGQRQRIAIARAVLMDAPVLVLDEATSSLDAESEMLVQKALEFLMENRTSIVIAHRLSTIRRADKIVVLDKGKVVEVGTHSELIANDGKYRRLYELQFAEEPLVGSQI